MSKCKILLVEDNEENWDMLARRLARRGYEVVVATDGQQGVEMHDSQRPNLILMDISLPIMDGWEATRQIRQANQHSEVPIIALTAHAMASDRKKSLEVGCNAFHTKPIEFTKLLQQIEELLRPSPLPPSDGR